MNSHVTKPRILVLTSTYPRYAGDPQPAFVHELARRLTDRYEIDVLAPHAPGLAKEEVLEGVAVHRFRYAPERIEDLAYDGGMLNRLRARPLRWLLVPLYLAAMTVAARRLIQQRGHSLIHAHWLIPQGFGALFSRTIAGRRVPVLCTLHGGDLYGFNRAFVDRLRVAILRRLDAVTVVSEAMRKNLSALGRSVPKSAVIPMGTDLTSLFTPDPSITREPILLFVGRLVGKKGVDVLLDSFAVVATDNQELVLAIVGDGPARPELEARAQRLGISSRVRFLGSLPNVQLPKLFQRATAAVFPFRQEPSGDREGFGLVVVEAMGCGCPVICGDTPAVRDIISNGDTGIVVKPNDPRELAAAMLDLLRDPGRCRALANAGRERAIARFDWHRTVAAFKSLIESVRT